MAQRKPAAPVKMKVHKNHGPKRHMFHCWTRSMRLDLARAGVLSKYDNKESFTLALNSRGVRANIDDMWEDFKLLPTKAAKDEFFKTIKERERSYDRPVKNIKK